MDAQALRIDELVGEACGLVRRVERGVAGRELVIELECLRAELLALARGTADQQAADAACGVVGDLDAALDQLGRRTASRAA